MQVEAQTPAAVRCAVQLFATAGALRSAVGTPTPPEEAAIYERYLAAARSQLGDAAFADAWAEGSNWPLEQGIAYALENTDAATT